MCWGKQYGDEDDECKNCDYKTSCRPETINYVSTRGSAPNSNLKLPPNYQLPVVQQQQYAPRFGMQPPQAPTLPQPSGYPQRPTAPLPPTHPYQGPQYQQATVGHQPHAPAGWNTPIAYLPRPNPQNPAWWQYQGETTSARLGKNILLTALQAIFSELLRFLANWTWPTVPSRT